MYQSLYNKKFFPNIKLEKKNSFKSNTLWVAETHRYNTFNTVEQFNLQFYTNKSLSIFPSKYLNSSLLNIDKIDHNNFFYKKKPFLKNYLNLSWYKFYFFDYNNTNNIRSKFLENVNFENYWWLGFSSWFDIQIVYLDYEHRLYHKIKNDNWWFDMAFWYSPGERFNRKYIFHAAYKRVYGVNGYKPTRRFLLRFDKKL